MSTTTKSGENGREATTIESRVIDFVDEFGVGSNYTNIYRGRIKESDEWKNGTKDFDMEQGVIVNPSDTIAIYHGEEIPELPVDCVDEIEITPQSVHGHGHLGAGAYTFKAPNGVSTTLTKDFIDRAGNVFGINPIRSLELIKLHERENYPIKISDPKSRCFILVAPRARSS